MSLRPIGEPMSFEEAVAWLVHRAGSAVEAPSRKQRWTLDDVHAARTVQRELRAVRAEIGVPLARERA